MLPQKMIGAQGWGVFTIVNTFLTSIFMLTDGIALQAIVNFGMNESKKDQTLTITFIIHLIFVLFFAVLIYLSKGFLADLFNEPMYLKSFQMFPLLCSGFLTRTYFLRVSQINLKMNFIFWIDFAWVFSSTLMILIGWKTLWIKSVDEMILIAIISPFISSIVGLILTRKNLSFTTKIDKNYFKEILKFGFSQCINSGTTALQTQGDAILLKIFYSSSVVGNYDIAKKLFRLFEALREAGSLTIYPAVARLFQEKRISELRVLIEKMMCFTSIGLIPLVLFSLFGPVDFILGLIYKGNYPLAPNIFRTLSIAAFFMPLTMNIYVLLGMGASKNLLKLNATSVLTSVFFGIILVPKFGAIGTAITVVISYALIGFASTRIVYNQIGFSVKSTFLRWKDASTFVMKIFKK
ncbi:MAG: oligosaccharide flippase family protein [Chlorobiota bacterium]|nr:MAG: oligosaccharide flippase family protein [Chlorobiota bacterium]